MSSNQIRSRIFASIGVVCVCVVGGIVHSVSAMRGCWIILLAALLASLLPSTQGQIKKRKEVTVPASARGGGRDQLPQVSIGYNLNFNPWKLSINKGLFERVSIAAQHRADRSSSHCAQVTGYTIKWAEVCSKTCYLPI